MTAAPQPASRPGPGRGQSPRPAPPRPSRSPIEVPGSSEVTERIPLPPQHLPAKPQDGAAVAPRPDAALGRPGAAGLAMKRRHPVAVWLGLPVITFGIYTFVWYYKIHREIAEFDCRRHVPVAGPMLVLLFLSWTVVAPLVSLYNTGHRIANAQRAAGLRPTCRAGIGLLLCFVFGLVSLYYQSELNKIVDAYAGTPVGSEVALRG